LTLFFTEQKFLILMKSSLLIISLMDYILCCFFFVAVFCFCFCFFLHCPFEFTQNGCENSDELVY